MVTIEFLGPIEMDTIKLDIKNLNELSCNLKNYSKLEKWLKNSAVAVNDEIILDKNLILKSGDKVSLLPPVCGG